MRLSLLAALLLSAATLSAQGPRFASLSPSDIALAGAQTLGCPVGMMAERQARGQQEWVASLEDAGRPQRMERALPHTAGVRVVLDGVAAKKMGQAEVAVYYMAPGVHALPVHDGRPAPASELRKTFVLTPADPAPSLRLAGDLLVGPASSVTRVRLLRITYADGSTWLASSGNDCSAEPGLMMAVAAR